MNILYDYQMFVLQRYGGVTNYFTRLANNLGLEDNVSFVVPTEVSTWLKSSCPGADFIPPSSIEAGSPLSSDPFARLSAAVFWRNRLTCIQQAVLAVVKSRHVDVFHPTLFEDYFLNFLGNVPFVLTIHDMTHEKLPEFFPDNDLPAKKKKLFRKASRVIAVSEATKTDIMSLYGVDDEKITVIYHGGGFRGNRARKGHLPQLPARYLLYVGVRSGYKNFLFFIESIADILRSDRSLFVVCTGAQPYPIEKKLFVEQEVEHQVLNYGVDNRELEYLYRNALAFIYPSLNEGFGLPVLEAFSCGCPALLSNRSSLPEVGGNAALYFDPQNAGSICETLQRILRLSGERDRLIRLGYRRMKMFSWNKTAEQTRAVYKRCIRTAG